MGHTHTGSKKKEKTNPSPCCCSFLAPSLNSRFDAIARSLPQQGCDWVNVAYWCCGAEGGARFLAPPSLGPPAGWAAPPSSLLDYRFFSVFKQSKREERRG